MGIKGVDHVVVRVKDIDEGIATYRDKFGMELERTAESDALGIKQAFFQLSDGGYIEVVAPTDDQGAVGRAVESRGEGIHTIAMAVDDMKAAIESMQAQGVQLIGADNPAGQVFVHPRSAHGVLVQLVEK